MKRLEDYIKKGGIHLEEADLPENVNALYFSDGNTEPVIVISESVETEAEKICLIAEELGHCFTSCGNLLTCDGINRTVVCKQEHIAKGWGIRKLLPLKRLIEAFESGAKDRYDMAEYLGVTEVYLYKAFQFYNSKYGKYKSLGNYRIYFDPPGFFKMFD